MNNLLRFSSLILVIHLFYFSVSAQSTHSAGGNNVWSFRQNVFIENNGQFNKAENGGRGKILFNTARGVNIFWNPQGLTYRATEHYLPEAERREMEKEGDSEEVAEKMKTRFHFLNVEWIGSNLDVQVVSEDPVSYYFTYKNPADKLGRSSVQTTACKKIIYRNMYPGIDVEYTLPENGGIEYSLIVHPGADVSVVKLRYKEVDKIKLNEKGEVEVYTEKCGNYMEHAPKTFYRDGTEVNSEFTLQNNIIGFNIPSYDKTKTLVIDPWVTPLASAAAVSPNVNPALAGQAATGYDIDYDLNGNVYVFGGADPLYLAKYNSGGVLQWVFVQPTVNGFDVNGNPSTDVSSIVGDMCVNRISGTAYVSEGYNANGAQIYKVDSKGFLKATYPGTWMNKEISRIRLNCSGQLFVTGGGVDPFGTVKLYQVASMDTNLAGPMTGAHITTSQTGDHDESLMTLDPSGSFMYVNFNYPAPCSSNFLENNDMFKVPIPGFTPISWKNPGPIYAFRELTTIPYAGKAPAASCSGFSNYWRLNIFNGMVCGNGFLYTYNGDTLKQWDKSTGAFIKEVRTGGTRYWSGGIDLDLCENVYVGVSNVVKEYDSGLNLVNTYPLPAGAVQDTSTYDVKFDKLKNKIYTTGNGYVAMIDVPAVLPQLTATFTPTSAGCSALCNGTATATMNANCATSTFTYTWLPGGQTTASINSLCPGTYTVIAKANITCAKTIGDTAFVTIPASTGNALTINASTAPAQCAGNNGSASVINVSGGSSPYTYQWSPGGTTSTITGLSAGNYSATVTDAIGCSTTQVVTVTSTPGLTVNASTAPGCTVATATVTTNGGAAPYTYLWNDGQTTSIAINLTTGTYTATIFDAGGCQGTQTVSVTTIPSPTAQFIPSAPCLGSNTTLTDASVPSPNDPIAVWNWIMPGAAPSSSPNQNTIAIYNTAGTHTVTLIVTTKAGCTDSIHQSVFVYNPPVANFVGGDSGCAPICVTSFNSNTSTSADGAITGWAWSFPGGNPSASNAQNPSPICYNGAGTYSATLIVTTQYGCKDTVPITPVVHTYAWPKADFCVSPDKQPTTNPVFDFCNLWNQNSGVTEWKWDFGDGTVDSVNMTPTHSYSATATQNDFYNYSVCLYVKNKFGCWDTICKSVELTPEFTFYIPNTFTPNDDNFNQFFFGKGRGIKEYNIWVFDRWGNFIWDCHYDGQNTDWDSPGQDGMPAACKWDGVVVKGGADMNGNSREIAQEDVYVWKVALIDIFDKHHSYIGHVSIVK